MHRRLSVATHGRDWKNAGSFGLANPAELIFLVTRSNGTTRLQPEWRVSHAGCLCGTREICRSAYARLDARFPRPARPLCQWKDVNVTEKCFATQERIGLERPSSERMAEDEVTQWRSSLLQMRLM